MRKKLSQTSLNIKSLPVFIAALVLVALGFFGAAMGSSIIYNIEKALGNAKSGISDALEARTLLEKQDAIAARESMQSAAQNFSRAHQELLNSSQAITVIASLPSIKQAANLLTAGSLISDGAADLLAIYQLTKDVNLSSQGALAKHKIPELVMEINTKNQAALDKVSQAEQILKDFNPSLVPETYKNTFNQIQNQLQGLKNTLGVSRDLLNGIYPLLTGKKTLLLLLQNDTELRPTGGFIGTYGKITLEDGVIKNVHVSSIYDIDGQLTEKISPPWPMLFVTGYWSLRDSNWFVDFARSALIIRTFYEKQGGTTPDAIIALTPKIFEDILSVTGPIHLPAHNTILDANGLLNTIQHKTSIEYDKTINQPKQLLADSFPVLMQAIFNSNSEQALNLAKIITTNLAEKNILINSRLEPLQKFAENYGWAGRIEESSNDYLSVNFANLSGSKSDRLHENSIWLNSTIKELEVINELQITRKLTRSAPSSTTLSFIRILVPNNARLLRAEGLELLTPPAQPPNNTSLRFIEEWNKSLPSNSASANLGAYIGQEEGKTVYAGFIKTNPGDTKHIKISYSIPVELEQLDTWSLLVQKQPGTHQTQLRYRLNYPDKRHLWNTRQLTPVNAYSIETGEILDLDSFIGVVLEDRNY